MLTPEQVKEAQEEAERRAAEIEEKGTARGRKKAPTAVAKKHRPRSHYVARKQPPPTNMRQQSEVMLARLFFF